MFLSLHQRIGGSRTRSNTEGSDETLPRYSDIEQSAPNDKAAPKNSSHEEPTLKLIIPKRTPSEQFRQQVLAIIGFNLSVNARDLNAALNGYTDNCDSILFDEERYEFIRLGRMVKKLRKQVMKNEWNMVPQADRDEVFNKVMVPAVEFKIRCSFALDLIASCADHRLDNEMRDHTLIRRCDYKSEKVCVLESHTTVVEKVAPNEKVRMILGNGVRLAVKNEDCGDKSFNFKHDEYEGREGYSDLRDALRLGRPHGESYIYWR